jgi:UDP-glucuronate 4-epimerase
VKVLVSGAAGFIGSHLVESLLAQGHHVVGLDAYIPYYPRSEKEENLSAARVHPNFVFYEADLRSDPLDHIVCGVDAIIHEAAMPGLPVSWMDFDQYMTCNIQATHRLLEASRKATIERFLYASTSSVYGLQSTGDELSVPAPVSPYGVTKLAAEQLCLAYFRTFGLPVVVCRYFSIFGPRQRPDMAYRIFIEALLTGRALRIFGDGRQSRGNTYISDCVDATLLILERGRLGEVYNVGGGTEAELIEIVRILETITGCKARIDYQPARPGDQRRTLANTSKIQSELGWVPRTSLVDGLAQEVGWLAGTAASPGLPQLAA